MHMCFACLRGFPAGSKLNYYVGIYDGDFSAAYCCLTCVEILNMSDDDGEGFSEGFVADALHKGQTPEILLDQMRQSASNSSKKSEQLS